MDYSSTGGKIAGGTNDEIAAPRETRPAEERRPRQNRLCSSENLWN
jgi:hypothetical protein